MSENTNDTVQKNAQHNLETICIHAGSKKDDTFNSVITPIYATATFEFEGPEKTKGYDYTRTGNPTRTALEECLAALEGGARAGATATGMAAITTVMHLFQPQDHIITGLDIYGGTYRLFEEVLTNFGLSFSFVDMCRPDHIKNALTPATKAVWIETPGNPLLNIVDLAAVTSWARQHNLMTIVDNTFLTPCFQRPFEFGVDLVVHSTTKYLNGHNDVVGGAIISQNHETGLKIAELNNTLGTGCSPFDAWLTLRGIKTLPYRMQAHEHNAQALAGFLSHHAGVERVYYPGLTSHPQHDLARRQMTGFGGMVSFDIKGGAPAAFHCIEKLQIFTFAESLGGVESLVEHPATMSHAAMSPQSRAAAGISDATIRLSVGLENTQDLIQDLTRALS